MTREKVIVALYNCIDMPKCRDCPWEECESEHMVVNGVPLTLLKDALELLKDQEPVKPMAGGLCGVGGWISVKDRLPKEFGEHCIVYNGSSVQYGDYYSNGEWYTPDCYESEEIRDVTHWMPMPEPPKEENSGNEQHMS